MDYFRKLMMVSITLAAFAALGNSEETQCRDTSEEATSEFSRDVRDAVCSLNRTAVDTVHKEIRARHGDNGTRYRRFTHPAKIRSPVISRVTCRSKCSDASSEDITWCVNIAYTNQTVEICVRRGRTPGRVAVSNSTCGAQLLGLENSLRWPSSCLFGGVGCLGLTNIDWYFNNAYLTCIVQTDDCFDTTFHHLRARVSTSTEPFIKDYSESPVVVAPGETLELFAKATSTNSRNFPAWRYGNITFNQIIHEDPYCTPLLDPECIPDSHTDAEFLRKQRIRMYVVNKVQSISACGSSLYLIDSYLIIDDAKFSDTGEYIFDIGLTSERNFRHSSQNMTAVVTTKACEDDPPSMISRSSNSSVDLAKGTNVTWSYELTAFPHTNFTLFLNKTAVSLSKHDNEGICGNQTSLRLYVNENMESACLSNFTILVQICVANDSYIGEYVLLWEEGGIILDGTLVDIKPIDVNPPVVDGYADNSEDNTIFAVYFVPLPALIVVLLVLIVGVLLLLRSRKRRRMRRITVRLQSPTVKDVIFQKKESELGMLSPLSATNHHFVCDTSFSDPLEFPRSRLYIFTNKVLGEGSFGRVLQARADGIVPGMPNKNIVAIKTTKENATSLEQEELLAELDLMKRMEPHANILNLLGQCTTPGGPLALIVEFASYGNLRDFLRQCEEVVLSLNHIPHIAKKNRSRTRTFSSSSCASTQHLLLRQDSVFTPGVGQHHFSFPSTIGEATTASTSSTGGDSKLPAQHPSTTVPMAHSVAPIGHDYINTKGLVYMEDVHNFALQIACGLQHLASLQIVHCDLAARNVLIAEGFVLKVADFGLARDISGKEMYKKNPRGKIPVKWTAPEALERRIFTTKSDVWSYGVVLWELFTYAHTPYPDVNLGQSYEAFITYLKEGNRMAQPESCPPSFYELMLECWHLDPTLRPSPHDIVAQLSPADDDLDSEVNGSSMVNSEVIAQPDTGNLGNNGQHQTKPCASNGNGMLINNGHQISQE